MPGMEQSETQGLFIGEISEPVRPKEKVENAMRFG